MTEYTVELPLPPKGCSQNMHQHWGVRKDAAKDYRNDCMLAYIAAKIPALPAPITLSLVFFNGGRVKGFDDGRHSQ